MALAAISVAALALCFKFLLSFLAQNPLKPADGMTTIRTYTLLEHMNESTMREIEEYLAKHDIEGWFENSGVSGSYVHQQLELKVPTIKNAKAEKLLKSRGW